MKKRILSISLAALLLACLWVPAAASEGEAPTEKAWDMALALNSAPAVAAECDVELEGTVVHGGYTASVHADMDFVQAFLADGGREIEASITVDSPEAVEYALAIAELPDHIVYYIDPMVSEDRLDRYETVPEGVFGDLGVLALHYAALGDDLLGATALSEGLLTYTMEGDALEDLVANCCPWLVEDCGALDWQAITADVKAFLSGGTDGSITITSPSLGQAILTSIETVERADDVQLTIQIGIEAIEEELTLQSMIGQKVQGSIVTEKQGAGYARRSLAEVIWSACEPSWNEVSARESEKDALRAALAGTAAAETEPAETEPPMTNAPLG